MNYCVISGREVAADLAARWVELQTTHVHMANPYFHPEFTRAVAEVREDVFVGILREGPRIVGFFPFQRSRGGIGRPVGLGLSDYQGAITEAGADWHVGDLLRGCRLIRYDFDHLLASQAPFAACHRAMGDSPILDLTGGYTRFEASRDKAGRKELREVERKRQRLETEIGPIRFVQHCSNSGVLETLMSWKSAQCRETGTVDYFALSWCRRLIERIHCCQGPGFGGILSCLYTGETLAAAHFAMRSDRVWHSWFPVYNHELQAYSPGMVLLVHMIRAAIAGNTAYIDFGKGVCTYKRRFMTGVIRVAEGSAELPSLLNTARRLRGRAEQWSRTSVLRPILRVPGRVVKSLERQKRYV